MKALIIFIALFLASCSSVKVQSKNNDLMSPCAGCDERVMPTGNLKYIS